MLVPISDAIKRQQDSAVRTQMDLAKNSTASTYARIIKDDSSLSSNDKVQTLQLIDNFSKIMDSTLGNSFTTSHAGDFGPYVMEVWPLVTAWYPDFPLKDLISVQSMDKPLTYLFFSELKTGTKKGDTAIGDVVETPLGARKLRGRYPTGEVFGEQILDTQIDSSQGTLLAYAPLNVSVTAHYLEKTIVKIDSTTYTAYNVVNNKILFKKGSTEQTQAAISLDVTTGQLNGSLITAKKGTTGSAVITVNYVWNVDYADTDNIQKVKEQVVMEPMEATPRAIALEWTLFSEYLKKSQFGIDIREDNTKRILNLLYQYQVRYILDEMFMYRNTDTSTGGHTDYDLSVDTTGSYSLEVLNASVQSTLKQMANDILKASGRVEGNRLVVGADFKSWLEALPSTMFTPAKVESAFMYSPRKIGTYGTFEVYFDPELAGEDFWMTYRGSEWYDAAYYLGEYMPITPTDCVALAVTVRSSFVSMESYFYHKKNCVIGGMFHYE
jgi:hypothetical protein